MLKGTKYLIGIIILGLVVAIFFSGRTGRKNKVVPFPTTSSGATMTRQGESAKTMNTNELIKEDLMVGTGDEAVSGKKVTVNYLGTLTDGTKFDSSYDRGLPFSFNLGAGEVIKGWDLGVAGMKVGGKRKLTIPSNLGYGESGTGGVIPPKATLIFEVELLKVE